MSRISLSPGPAKVRMIRAALPLLIVTGVIGSFSPRAIAQSTVVDEEPNNTPQTAIEVTAPAIIAGSMGSNDQDAYNWVVSDVDAGKRWTIALDGIPGRLTIIDVVTLTYNDDGEVAGKRSMFRMGTRDGALPTVADGLILEPGEYLLGLAHSGGTAVYRPPMESASFSETAAESGDRAAVDTGAYRLKLVEGLKLPASRETTHTSKEDAWPVYPEREVTAFLEDASSVWYEIEFKDEHVSSRWDVNVQVPIGRRVIATLTQEDGTRLTQEVSDQRGKLSLPDLALPPGSYFLEVAPDLAKGASAGFLQTTFIEAVGQRVDGDEAEPNNSWKQANRIVGVNCCAGRIGERSDKDIFAFSLDESQADQLHAITLDTGADKKLQLCLLSATGGQVQCRDGSGQVVLGNLLLAAGEYGIQVGRGTADTEYRFALVSTGTPQPGVETEPNEAAAYATGTPSNNRIKGSFDVKGDVDFYRFVVADEAQLWRVQVIGDTLAKVEYHDAAGHQRQQMVAKRNVRRLRLDNLFLLPGVHHVSVTGAAAGDYTLLARGLGPPDPNGELEPNDDTGRMQPLRFGQKRTGYLADSSDADMYRFYLADWDHIRLVATPPADGQLQAELSLNKRGIQRKATKTDGPVMLEGVFPPGDYQLKLSPRDVSEAEYSLLLERQDRFTCADDCEPNDGPQFASPMPAGQVIQGRSGDWADFDWYRLPLQANNQPVRFAYEATALLDLRVFDENLKRIEFNEDRTDKSHSGILPANQATYLRLGNITRTTDYTVTMLLGDETVPPAPAAELAVELSLELDTQEVAAYERVGQQVTGRLVLQNDGDVPLEMDLQSAASDARWQARIGQKSVALAAGAKQTIDVTVLVPDDAWADIPVRIGAQATAADGRTASSFADLAVGRDALPVNPLHTWDVPAALRGGMNVALGQFGATATSTPKPSNIAADLLRLFDGMVSMNQGPEFSTRGDNVLTITVDLAGDSPIPVAGFAVNPLSRPFTTSSPKDLVFQLSIDGTSFNTVASGQLTTVGKDQFFVLDNPEVARFARLLVPTSWSAEQGRVFTFGEWKVIAEPGFDPFGGNGLNVADSELGGHVVWAKPRISVGWDRSILTVTESEPVAKVPADDPLEWVVAFHNNRAAQIAGIEWVESQRTSGTRIDELSVSASLNSPVGPWQPITNWSRSSAGDTLSFDTPVWARFLRFSVPSADVSRVMSAPATLIIHEAPTGADYRSVLSEWGLRSESAFYESLQPITPLPQLAQRGNESRPTADVLMPGNLEAGLVQLGEQSQWYRPTVPDGHNTARFTVTGEPTVRAELELTAADGSVLPVRKIERESTTTKHVFEAQFEVGDAIDIEVREPPRNVMFLWDTSPSVAQHLPMIYNSLLAYAEDLVPGRDAANFMPFGGATPLMRDWYGEPYLMQMILNDYPRDDSSSSAEHTQFAAARALAPRPGTKAIVMVTDARTPQHRPMWDMFKQVRPRVFVMKVSSGIKGVEGINLQQDLSQDWSRVNGGHYTHLDHEGDMEVAFDRAATLLRRPANYTLTMQTEFREAPGPGFLEVVSGADATKETSAVELILDASGSMWKKLDGRFRIDIAKEVLTSALNKHIPPDTPVAMRVFGHRKPNACDTNLEIALQPLNVEQATATLAGVMPQSLAKTPIAASLAAVSKDLRGNTGAAVVVLVTDGEETCNGDPAVEIEKLENAGFQMNLNIVGFAIDDDVLAAQFETWAEAGGGRYFAANDADGLNVAVAQALATPFKVFDQSGEVVAEGVVGGEPVELEQGVYRVVAETAPSREFNEVTIRGESTISLEIGGR